MNEERITISRDVMSDGVGLIAAQRINHKQLSLQMHLAYEEVNVVAEVRWCRPMGPFEGIGCRFIALKDHERDAICLCFEMYKDTLPAGCD